MFMTTTTAFVTGFLIGAVILDFLWAWKFGIPQIFWSRVSHGIRKIYSRLKYYR